MGDLVQRRLVEFNKQAISGSRTAPLQIPPGLTVCQKELAQIAGGFVRLVSYNRAVFDEFYDEIISNHVMFLPTKESTTTSSSKWGRWCSPKAFHYKFILILKSTFTHRWHVLYIYTALTYTVISCIASFFCTTFRVCNSIALRLLLPRCFSNPSATHANIQTCFQWYFLIRTKNTGHIKSSQYIVACVNFLCSQTLVIDFMFSFERQSSFICLLSTLKKIIFY